MLLWLSGSGWTPQSLLHVLVPLCRTHDHKERMHFRSPGIRIPPEQTSKHQWKAQETSCSSARPMGNQGIYSGKATCVGGTSIEVAAWSPSE